MRQEITMKSGNNLLKGYLEFPEHQIMGKFPIAILLHGLCNHKNEEPQASLATYFLQHQIAVLRMDFNGHGDSSGLSEDMTVLNELEDAEVMLHYVKSLSFVSKIIVVGHSQGGVVASMLAGKYADEIDGLILLAPAAILEECARKGEFSFLEYDPENIPDRMKISGWDFWIGRKYLETSKNLNIYENSKAYRGKVCIIQGEDDMLVPMKYAIQYERIYKDARLNFVPDCDHVFSGKLEELVKIVDVFVFYNVLR